MVAIVYCRPGLIAETRIWQSVRKYESKVTKRDYFSLSDISNKYLNVTRAPVGSQALHEGL